MNNDLRLAATGYPHAGGERSLRVAAKLVCAALLFVAGCGKTSVPEFHLNMQGRDPKEFTPTKENAARIKGRQDIATALYAMFGTPDDPYVFVESGLDLTKIEMAAGPFGGNEDGTQRGLFRQHCVHCHGINGDGAGPTALFLTPYPRDYRRGLYKFKATERASRPTHADLKRTLFEGIAGTAMPSFMLLPDDELEALVEYVKYLSIRGEVETSMSITVYVDEEELDMSRTALVDTHLKPIAELWTSADQSIIGVPDRPQVAEADRARWLAGGAELFKGAKAQCMKCHGPTALGDGSEEALFDDWNKDKKADLASTYLLPKQQIHPRNLRMGIYRFGRSPADTYRRIHAGVNGTPMPGAGPGPGSPGTLKPDEIWQIVDYIRSLPYDAIEPALGNQITLNKPRN
ncbi:MAG TPA: c-type cytochrome [Pirellulales bacterium]|nr:c-type cytochrome [Pirellulales bacterium]